MRYSTSTRTFETVEILEDTYIKIQISHRDLGVIIYYRVSASPKLLQMPTRFLGLFVLHSSIVTQSMPKKAMYLLIKS